MQPLRRGVLCARTRAVTPLTSWQSALLASQRTYFWPYNEDFVPKGEATSRFQSSGVPSVRERIIREYALGPLFSDRVPCCVLGFAGSARDVIGHKSQLRAALTVLFSASAPEEISFGTLQQTKEMMLFRPDTSESPRLADGARSRTDSEQRRRTQYARHPVQARTVLEVFFEPVESESTTQRSVLTSSSSSSSESHRAAMTVEEPHDDDAESQLIAATALGRLVQDQLEKVEADASTLSSTASAASEDEEEARSLQHAAARLRELGVVYCELPEEDVSDYVFDELHGAPVDDGMLERVMDRWERRLQQLQGQGIEARTARFVPATRSPE